MSDQHFPINSLVRLKASPERKGRIVSASQRYSGGTEYLVLIHGGGEAWYSGADLELAPDVTQPKWGPRDQFLRSLLLAKLKAPFSDSLYSYRASRTVFEPYQFRPALKFLRNPEQRILIADEVGLGKTIEAAIIYLELKARLNISRVLVLCPSRLKAKWYDEMRNRFEEDFDELDARGIQRIIQDYERVGDALSFRAIASYEALRRNEFIEVLLERQLHLDLLIVDEAHHMRNTTTATHKLGTILCDNADAVIFLTATPLHLGTNDLYNLLHLLAPSDFDDPRLFQEYIRPNRHINHAAQLLAAGRVQEAQRELRRVEGTLLRDRYVGNPLYEAVLERMQKQQDMPSRVALQRDLLDLNTLSAVFTRTRKREVSQAAVRAAFTITVDLLPEERAFYEGVVLHVRRQLRQTISSSAIGFAQVMKERQAASCLAATREYFEAQVKFPRRESMQVERSIFDLGEEEDSEPEQDLEQGLLALARRLGNRDSKFEQFERVLREVLAANSASKVLVFSTFKRTLSYLHRRLVDAGIKTDVIHGDVPVVYRQAIIEQFRTEPDFRVLLSSEVGAEGLDFQFCDVLVNYDLPWNPMQVEQRIGRLDRFGQEHERIRIYNFYINETIETRIFQRLYDRIGIFEESIGDLEDILGEEIRDLQRKALQPDLTPEEQERLAGEAAARIVRRQVEGEALERQKDEFLGQQHIFSQQVLDAVNSGRVVHPEEVRALVTSFLAERFPEAELAQDDEEPTWTLTITPDLAEALRPYLYSRQKQYQFGTGLRRAMGMAEVIVDVPGTRSPFSPPARIKNPSRQVALTFDSEFARQRPLLEFVTLQHVLVGMAIDYWQERQPLPGINVKAKGPLEEVGCGYLFLYALEAQGVSRNVTLEPVLVLDDGRLAQKTAETILKQIQEADYQQVPLTRDDQQLERASEIAGEYIARQRDAVRDELQARNTAMVRARSAAIEASFAAKIKRTETMLAQATDPRIQRLREGQLRKLEARRQQKLQELQKGDQVVVSYSLLGIGRVEIEAGAVSAGYVEDFEPLLGRLEGSEIAQRFAEQTGAEDLSRVATARSRSRARALALFKRWLEKGF